MLQYIVRRVLQMIPVIFVLSVMVFVLNNLLPGDLAIAVLGEQRAKDDQAYARMRAELHLDDPVPVRYGRWLGNVMRGEFGKSYRTNEEVRSALLSRLPRTFELAAFAFAISLLIGIPAGIVSALRPNGRLDTIGTVLAISGVAIPNFWLGLMLIYLFAFVIHLFPGTGYVSPTEDIRRNLELMVLPAFALGVGGAAVFMRQTRSSLLEVLQQDYIRTARSKGLREQAVVIGHALKNALIPVVTIVGLHIGRLLGGAVVVEMVFGIPGMGRWAAESVFYRDFAAIQAVVLVIAGTVLVANLLTDITYSYLDPRIRLK